MTRFRRATSRLRGGPASGASRRATATDRHVLTLTIIDQGASSLSNFALAVLVAHYSDAREIGIFALLTVTIILSQGMTRSLTSDCLLTRAETDDEVMGRYERSGYVSAILVSLVFALVLLVVSAFLSTSFAIPFLILALTFPFMTMQDYARFIGISRHDPAYSIRLDAAWVVLFLAAYAGLRVTGLVSLPWLFGAWAGAGGLVGLSTLRSHISRGVRELLRFWVRSEQAIALRFAGQYMLVSSWAYFVFYLLVFVISIQAVGTIKLAQLALGPIPVMSIGMQSALISLASKKFRIDTRRALMFLAAIAALTSIATIMWIALVYFAPLHLMTSALGSTWPRARGVVPYIGLGFLVAVLSGAATAGLRAMRAAQEILRLALIMVPILFVPCIGGAALWGARGYAIGTAVAGGIYAVLAWILLVRVASRFDPAREPADTAVESTPV
jgi:hypothetical protein